MGTSLMSYSTMAPMYATTPDVATMQSSELNDVYTSELGQPDSFATGMLRLPQYMLQIKAYAGVGNMSKAKEAYDQLNRFYSDHTDEIVQAVTIDPKGHKVLAEIQRGAAEAFDRQFDRAVVQTPYGEMSVAELFGPNGTYQQAREMEVRNQNFSQLVVDSVTGEDRELAEILSPLTNDPSSLASAKYMHGRSRLSSNAPLSQRQDLAHTIASRWAQDSQAITGDAVRAIVSYVQDHHMADGTAATMYKTLVDLTRTRREVGDPKADDPVAVASDISKSFDMILKRYGSSADGTHPPAETTRFLTAAVAKAAAGNSDLDLTDLGTQYALGDLMGTFAGAQRSGIDLLPLMMESGIDFDSAVTSYITHVKQGLPPPQENAIVQIQNAGKRLDYILSSQWPAATNRVSRGNPRDQAGTGAGAFGASSGSIGLDIASIAVKSSLFPEVLRIMGQEECDELSALHRAVQDPATIDAVAKKLSSAMMLPAEATTMIARQFLTNLSSGDTVRPVSLEQAIADVGIVRTGWLDDDDAMREARKAVSKWYAANLGPRAAEFQKRLQGWHNFLSNDVIGFGTSPSGRAAAEAFYQQALQAVSEAAENGLDITPIVAKFSKQGQFYQIVGFRDPITGTVIDKIPEKDKDGKKIDINQYTPVIEQVVGDLDSATQETQNYAPLGVGRLPVFGPGSFSRNPMLFIQMQRQLKQLFDAQQKAAAASLTEQVKQANTDEE